MRKIAMIQLLILLTLSFYSLGADIKKDDKTNIFLQSLKCKMTQEEVKKALNRDLKESHEFNKEPKIYYAHNIKVFEQNSYLSLEFEKNILYAFTFNIDPWGKDTKKIMASYNKIDDYLKSFYNQPDSEDVTWKNKPKIINLDVSAKELAKGNLNIIKAWLTDGYLIEHSVYTPKPFFNGIRYHHIVRYFCQNE